MRGAAADERLDIRAIFVPMVGLAIAVALYGLAVWAPTPLLAGHDDVGDGLPFLASGAHAATLLVLAAAAWALPGRWRRVNAAVACVALVGALVLWGASFALGVACPSVVAAAAGILSGVAVAALFLWWLGHAGRLSKRPRHALLAGAAGGAALISMLGAVPSRLVLRISVCVLLVAAVGLVAYDAWATHRDCSGLGPSGCARGVARASEHSGHLGRSPRSRPSLVVVGHAFVQLLPILAASVVISLAAPFVNGVLMVDALPLQARSVISGLMGLLVAAVLGVAWLLARRIPSVLALLLTFTIVLFAAFVLNAALGMRLSLAVLALSSAGYFLVLYLFMEAALDVARGAALPVALVYGSAGALVMVARIVADALSLRLLHAGLTEDVKVLVAMFLMVYLLTCAGFALYHALTRRPRQTAAGAGTSPAPGEQAAPGVPDTSGPGPAAPSDWELLARKCDLVATSRDLSQREHEVLVLMMRGRNVPAISEELSISRNTVQTHVRHLYEALGVHSRKELVALVESAGERTECAD